MTIINGFLEALKGLFLDSGFTALTWQNYAMMAIACFLIWLAIKKQFEPLLLLPIAFGMLLVNLFPAIMAPPATEMVECSVYEAAHQGQVIN
ncbi:MAG: sodium ion-translocating decarboxylase subunit beta, partial [Clostridia bacterium]|nr:sodium ion-translocating decarboxylase subunit beta [Clostridia bacterium]